MGDLFGQIPRFLEFLDVFLRDGGSHPLALHSRSGHGCSVWWRWERSILGRKKAWGKKLGPYPLIRTVNIKHPFTSLKTRLFPRDRANGTVGIPKPVLMRIPQ